MNKRRIAVELWVDGKKARVLFADQEYEVQLLYVKLRRDVKGEWAIYVVRPALGRNGGRLPWNQQKIWNEKQVKGLLPDESI